jgi:hypothetical protein
MSAVVADTHAAVWYLLNLPLVTRDSDIQKTAVKTIW